MDAVLMNKLADGSILRYLCVLSLTERHIMLRKIFIEEDKEFSVDDFAHIVSLAIRSVSQVDFDKAEIVFSRDDVYFTIVDFLGYINERIPGRLKIDQTTFQQYIVHYVPDAIRKQKATQGLLMSKVKSALIIEERTGELPTWAQNDEAIMEAISEHKSSPPAAAPTVSENLYQAQAEVNEHIEELAQNAVKAYRETGIIPDTATKNMAVMRRFYELTSKEGGNDG